MFNLLKDKKFDVNVLLVLEDNLPEELKTLKEKEIFSGKVGQTYENFDMNNNGIIYVGLGNKETDLDDIRLAGFNLGKVINKRKLEEVSIDFSVIKCHKTLKGLIEGLIDSNYSFDFYKPVKSVRKLKTLGLLNYNFELKEIETAFSIMEGVFLARDLINLTPIDLYPESYANKALEIFKDTNVKVEVYNKEQIEELGMHALLSVSLGSDKEPRFLVYKYFNNPETTKHLTIVGKGVTYDSGGYAIKPASSMATMKDDMSGSAAVVGLMKTLSLTNLPVNVVGVTALTENMIDGKAYKNGDVIKSMKGTTIEVLNTDAEGRLTLADAIYYSATKLESTEIIELSTLTGAAVNALGSHITAITTEYDELYDKVHKAGIKAGEFNWRMPITKQLKDSVKGEIAELRNSVSGGGGMMTAGIFLSHFAENVPFIHLDIAGTAFGSAYRYLPSGASGVGVKTLFNYIKDNLIKK